MRNECGGERACLFAVDLVLRRVEVLDERDDVGVRNLEHHVELPVLSRGGQKTYWVRTGSNLRVRLISTGERDLPPITGTTNHDIGTSTPH